MASESLPAIQWVIDLALDADLLQVDYKLSSADLLTETDVAVEKFLIAKIKEKYSSHAFLCEESSTRTSVLSDGPTWVIDPVDGTANFVHTLPFVAVSIGFTVNKQPQLGVIYTPILNELFYAVRGEGAWMVSRGNSDAECLKIRERRSCCCTAYTFQAYEEETRQTMSDADLAKCAELKEISIMNIRKLLEGCRDIRRLGSCATELAFIAAGRLDASCELGIKEWDLAAGVLIVQEAGGFTTDYDGNRLTDIGRRQVIAASSSELCQELAAVCTAPNFSLRELEK